MGYSWVTMKYESDPRRVRREYANQIGRPGPPAKELAARLRALRLSVRPKPLTCTIEKRPKRGKFDGIRNTAGDCAADPVRWDWSRGPGHAYDRISARLIASEPRVQQMARHQRGLHPKVQSPSESMVGAFEGRWAKSSKSDESTSQTGSHSVPFRSWGSRTASPQRIAAPRTSQKSLLLFLLVRPRRLPRPRPPLRRPVGRGIRHHRHRRRRRRCPATSFLCANVSCQKPARSACLRCLKVGTIVGPVI